MEFTNLLANAPRGAFVTESRMKAWFYSALLRHRVVTRFFTPEAGPFGTLTYRRRYVLAPMLRDTRQAS